VSRHELLGRGNQVGLTIAAGIVPATFQRSLSERSWIDQGIITGLSASTHYLLTVVTQDLIDTVGEAVAPMLPLPDHWSMEQRNRAATWLVDAAAIPLGFGAVAAIGFRDDETRRRALVRQAGWRVGLTGLGGTILGVAVGGLTLVDDAIGAQGRLSRLPMAVPLGLGVATALESWRQRENPPEHRTDPAGASPWMGLGAGAGVVLVLGGGAWVEQVVAGKLGSVTASRLPGSEATWRRIAHLGAVGGMAYGTTRLWGLAMRRIEAGTTSLEEGMDDETAGTWTSPLVSGSPESLVSWDSLGREGRRHAVTFVRPAPLENPAPLPLPKAAGVERPDLSISTVMGETARAMPIQVFVGLDSAPTPSERVELALAEMDRTDAWSRSLLMLCSPTGTGYVNYVAVAAAQYMTRGDMATVTLQYSKRPSPLSLAKVKDARIQNRLLWLRIFERVREMAPEERPKVVLFGESLGAHTSQSVLEGWGTLGPQALGIDRALWIGTPAASKWRHELMDPNRADVDRDIVAVVNDYEQFLALGDAKERKRYVLLSHDNDGVVRFEPDLLVKRPTWLGPDRPRIQDAPGRSPRGIPSSMRWRPVTTFFQTLIDMKNAQIPGAYRAFAHDYRPDLPEFIRDVFDLECSDDQLAAIKLACEQREAFRETIFS